jgi:hypothetical protein
MATTAKSIVPAPKAKGQKARKPMTKQHKAKLVAALANWRVSLTDEDREALAEQSRKVHQERWSKMTKQERDARLAGVRAWQAQQRAAKADKAKPVPKVGARKAPPKDSRRTEVSERTARKGTVKLLAESTRPLEADLKLDVVEEARKRTRKAATK